MDRLFSIVDGRFGIRFGGFIFFWGVFEGLICGCSSRIQEFCGRGRLPHDVRMIFFCCCSSSCQIYSWIYCSIV